MEGIVDEPAECFLSLHFSRTGDIFGDPEVLPRVGDQYQVVIPPLMMEYDHLQLIRKPTDPVVSIDVLNYFSMGLPIPVMWVQDNIENIKDEALEVHVNRVDAVTLSGPLESQHGEESRITSNNEDAELKLLDTAMDDRADVGGLSNLQPMFACDKMDVDLVLPQEKKTKLDHGDHGYHPVPGSLSEDWKDTEYDSFLLGLYIFGKNFLLVKKIVESKEMGDILSYYYGEFYRSEEYGRWSECRKMSRRRCIYGQRIFTGWRQQELLSRLFSHVSEECKNTLMEVSRKFGEGKLSLEEYVFTLKDMVGTKMLVEAVAIGKGKHDLTGTAMEPVKTNHFFAVRPEIPIGRACSSLTSAEIVKFLTGDFRLSKARSSDLFWEAVWPRLLARGWHSEQPKNHGFVDLKHSLVFLIPGVKKFSRRRLVKGNHYFDSVSDVLKKVASEPGLLELEFEAANVGTSREEYRSDTHMKQDPDILPNRQRHCYLQPRNSNCKWDSMKFTIVDTSLVCGEEQVKVRELRSFPVDPRSLSTPSGVSSEIEEDNREESRDEAEENNSLNHVEYVNECGAFADSPEFVTNTANNNLSNGPVPVIAAVANHEDQSTRFSNDRQSRMMMKFQFSRKGKSRQSNYLAPITKQHQLTSSRHGESSHGVENISVDTKPNGDESHFGSHSNNTVEIMALQVGPSQNLSSANSLAGSPEESSKGILNENCMGTEPSLEKPNPQTLLDLNLPHVTPDSVTDEPLHNDDDLSARNSFFLSETSQLPELLHPSNAGSSIERLPVMNGPRQSTRNRPLTTKALEALACGFLSPKRKRKSVNTLSQINSMSRCSRRVRGKASVNTSCNDGATNDVACYKMDEGVDGVFSCKTNLVIESHKRS